MAKLRLHSLNSIFCGPTRNICPRILLSVKNESLLLLLMQLLSCYMKQQCDLRGYCARCVLLPVTWEVTVLDVCYCLWLEGLLCSMCVIACDLRVTVLDVCYCLWLEGLLCSMRVIACDLRGYCARCVLLPVNTVLGTLRYTAGSTRAQW